MGKLAVCEGEVVMVNNKVSTIEWYSEEFVLSDSVKDIGVARSMLQAGLIASRLRPKVTGFRRVRTCQVVKFEDTSEKPASSAFDALLMEAVELSCVPEQIDKYATDESKAYALKTAIARHKERVKLAAEADAKDEIKVPSRRGRSPRVSVSKLEELED